MKKWLSFLITLCLILNTAIPVFSESDTDSAEDGGLKIEKDIVELQPVFSGGARGDSDVYNDIVFDEPMFFLETQDKNLRTKAELLYNMGIIDSIDWTGEVCRAQFVAMVTKLANISVKDVSFSEYFLDVTSETAYHDEIEAAAVQGIISGNDGKFNPQRAITLHEGISVIMKAIGYTTMSEINGGYPFGYMQMARSCGVLSGVSADGNAALTGEQAVALLYNTLSAHIMEPDTFTGGSVTYDKEQTVLSYFHNMYVVNGQVTANHISSFRKVAKTDMDKICIGEVAYAVENNNQYADYLGYNVKAYIREAEDKHTVVCMVKNSGVKETLISASDIETFSDYTYYYGENANGTYKKASVSPNHTLIVNGIRQSDYTTDIFVPENGEVILVYNNDSKQADVVIINEYQPFLLNQFKGTDKNELEFISVDKGVKFFIDPNNDEQTLGFYIDGFRFDVNSQYVILQDADGFDYRQNILPKIPTPSILNIFADKYTTVNGVKVPAEDASYVRINISTKTVEGTTTGFSSSDNLVTIGEEDYKVAKRNLFSTTDPSFGLDRTGKFFFDCNGEIVAWIPSVSGGNAYGYLIDAQLSPKAFGEYTLYLKIMDTNGKIGEYICRDKVVVNGNLEKELPVVYSKLQTAAAFVHTDGRISQLVKFSADEKEVTSLEVLTESLAVGKTANQLTRNCERQTLLSRSENFHSFYHGDSGVVYYNYSSDCKAIFSVPVGGGTNDEDYYVLSSWGEDKLGRVVEMYDTNEYLIPGAVVVYREPREELHNPYFMVDHVSKQVDEKGDIIAVVYGTNGNAALNVSYVAADVTLFDSLQCGDFIKLYGKNDLVTDYDLLMSVDTVKNFDFSTPFTSSGNSVTDLFELYSVYNASFMVLQRGTITENGVRVHQQCNHFSRSGGKHFIYDATGGTPKIEYFYNLDALETALNDGNEKANKVFIYTSATVTKFMVVYKGI